MAQGYHITKQKRGSEQDCTGFLHWLPIEFRTKFKLMKIMFKTSKEMVQTIFKQNIPKEHQEINSKMQYLKCTIK